MARLDTGHVEALYRAYASELRAARDEQRAFLAAAPRGFRAQLDDIEAEITYLLLRETRPRLVVEVGALHGWSTTWILRALRDNGTGVLRSFDIADRALDAVPPELAVGRWELVRGDARRTLPALPPATDYLFVDADHGARFARWYLSTLLGDGASGLTVGVHDVFHGRRAKPFGEGRVVLRWLAEHGAEPFTAARRRGAHERIRAVRAEIGITRDIRAKTANPMIYFRL